MIPRTIDPSGRWIIFTGIVSTRPEKHARFRIGYVYQGSSTIPKDSKRKNNKSVRPLTLIFVGLRKPLDTIDLDAIIKTLKVRRMNYRYAKIIYSYNNATSSEKLHTEK